MTEQAALKCAVLGVVAAVLVLFASGAKPALAVDPLPFPSGMMGSTLGRLISCPNYNGSDDNKVDVGDVVAAVNKYRKDYPDPNYWSLMDAQGSGGQIRVDDVTWTVNHYRNICPAVDTQIAKATQAIANPNYTDKLCDEAGNYMTAVNCGGDLQFLTENATFLAGKGYLSTDADVPGQGVHYAKLFMWDGVFNPARPEGLVYKNGRLVAQLYYSAGGVVGWGADRDSNQHGVNTDAFCNPLAVPQPTGACGWNSTYDGWHWHENLCTIAIGTTNAQFARLPSQDDCATWALTQGVTCVFLPSPGFNCTWNPALGWMGHLWNWYPNANFTNAASGVCQPALCATGESNGRFADCFPDVQGWNAFNCPS